MFFFSQKSDDGAAENGEEKPKKPKKEPKGVFAVMGFVILEHNSCKAIYVDNISIS